MNEKGRISKLKEQLNNIKAIQNNKEIKLIEVEPKIVKQKVKRSNREVYKFLLMLFVFQISFVVMFYLIFKK